MDCFNVTWTCGYPDIDTTDHIILITMDELSEIFGRPWLEVVKNDILKAYRNRYLSDLTSQTWIIHITTKLRKRLSTNFIWSCLVYGELPLCSGNISYVNLYSIYPMTQVLHKDIVREINKRIKAN